MFDRMMLVAAAMVTCAVMAAPVGAAATRASTEASTRASTRPGQLSIQLPAGKHSVTLKLARGWMQLFARTSIDGQDAGWFGVDTGASGLIIDAAVARRLKLKPVGTSTISAIGGGGSLKGDIVVCDALTIASADVGHQRDSGGGAGAAGRDDDARAVVERPVMLSADLAGLTRIMGIEMAGVIGGDVLRAAPCTIDFRDATLTFHDPAAFRPPPATTTPPQPMSVINRCPAVRASVVGREAWFGIDTGSGAQMNLSAPFIGINRDLLDGKAVISSVSMGAAGRSDNFEAHFESASVMGRNVKDVIGTFTSGLQSGSFRSVALGGQIGAAMLKQARLTLDYAGERLWIEWRDPEPLDAALARMRDWEKRDLSGATALMFAASAGRADAVAVLLDAGADVNAADKMGFTALMSAAGTEGESEQCTRLLLAHKADPNAQAVVMGITPLLRAAEEGNAGAIKLLLAAGAKPDVATTLSQTPLSRAVGGGWHEAAAALLKGGANPSPTEKDGVTPLMIAADAGDVEMVRLLLDHHAPPDVRNQIGKTALGAAAWERKTAVVKLMLSRGAATDVRFVKYQALHLASAADDAESVQALLDAGADINAKDTDGQTPLQEACGANSTRAVKVLMEARGHGAGAPGAAGTQPAAQAR